MGGVHVCARYWVDALALCGQRGEAEGGKEREKGREQIARLT